MNKGMVDAEGYYNEVAGRNGILQEYIYDATNVRPQELSLGYTLPKKWLANKAQPHGPTLVGRNLWMIYNKAPSTPRQRPPRVPTIRARTSS